MVSLQKDPALAKAEQEASALFLIQFVAAQRTRRLLVGGSPSGFAALVARLTGLPHLVTFERLDETPVGQVTSLMIIAEKGRCLSCHHPMMNDPSLTLLVWNRDGTSSVALAAYEQGVRTVLEPDFDPALLPAMLQVEAGDMRIAKPPSRERLRRLERGEHILLTENQVLEVKRGILRCMTMREDGAEVLLGLFHAGDIMLGHDPDHCQVTTIAHTDTTVSIQRWDDAMESPSFHHKLLERICYLEHWASILAKPNLEDRLTAMARLLSRKFNCEETENPFSELRLTHEQIANALGSARTSITRALAKKRRKQG
ncbi:Crp/Fnr family transcriptional regulator [Acanthopleuribacter pedis]|uniref:Crp/Fnr family transcriptional regulator n=1 Tax=Acanthopleuribacter pedis TaxID=442870 RepID=A0A8J7U4R4_9BACT|nr:Crp/Fnr family transcriptional regulator [Acanthopleuribacter pedis]MBO1319723.1 Crp/Fnr family transcriptional regulator [Acanthopleuribacter pedis]